MGFSVCAGNGPRAARAAERLAEIQTGACTLVIERGYDGFTMDELAEKVGVSRRTLFNHVPDKASAVLGPQFTETTHPALADFRTKKPHGTLRADLVAAIEAFARQADASGLHAPSIHRLVNDAIASDARVAALVMTRFEAVTRQLESLVCEREGWPTGDLRARALAAWFLALIKLTMDEMSQRHEPTPTDFLDLFHEVLAADTAVRPTD